MQDLNDKITGNTLTATEWNEVPSEIQNVIEALGQTLSSGDLDQLGKSIAGYIANANFYTDTGIADAYVLTKIGSKQAATAYTDGFTASFIVGNTNTGASTVNIAGLGIKNVVGSEIAGSLVAGEYRDIKYRSSSGNFVLTPFNSRSVSYTPAGIGAVASNVQAKLREGVSPEDFGVTGGGVVDDSANLVLALNSGARIVRGTPGAVYLVESNVAVITASTIFDLNGATLKQGATWVGTELITFTKEFCGLTNGTVQGNSDATDATHGIIGNFSALVPDSQSTFRNLFILDMGDIGLKINNGDHDQVHNILCTNNAIATSPSTSGNVRFDDCNELQSSNFNIWESFGKGVAWVTCTKCTHDGLVVNRDAYSSDDEGGFYTAFSDDISISNVFTKNVSNKLSQFSTDIFVSNFNLFNSGNKTLQLQGASGCKFTTGKAVGTATTFTTHLDRHPDSGSGVSDSTNNTFSDVKITANVEIPLLLDGNTSGNKFLNCLMVEEAADATGAATDYVVVDFGTGNAFKECNVEVSAAIDFGGMLHSGPSWVHTDCVITAPRDALKLTAAGRVKGGSYKSTNGNVDCVIAAAALRMEGADALVDGSTSAVSALRLEVAGSRIIHSSLRTVTDTTSGYGVLFVGADVEDTQIMHCNTAGDNRSIKSVTQSTTNKLSFITIEGGGIDNGVNGTTNPGAHHSEYIGS